LSEQSNSQWVGIQISAKESTDEGAKKVKSEILREELNELFETVVKFYFQPLEIFSNEKVKNVFNLEYSDRELIARMIAYIINKKGLIHDFIKLYQEKAVDFYVKLAELTPEPYRLVDIQSGKLILRKPNIYEFYSQLRKIVNHEIDRDRGDLVVFIGKKILDKYSSEDIEKQYRDSLKNA